MRQSVFINKYYHLNGDSINLKDVESSYPEFYEFLLNTGDMRLVFLVALSVILIFILYIKGKMRFVLTIPLCVLAVVTLVFGHIYVEESILKKKIEVWEENQLGSYIAQLDVKKVKRNHIETFSLKDKTIKFFHKEKLVTIEEIDIVDSPNSETYVEFIYFDKDIKGKDDYKGYYNVVLYKK
ncbi:MAG TPA: hypothetical protein VIG73_00395 [Cerasibacillus sp.]|uniref:hypothetical protein n=1 Tax=Cerasibacillus sp. TaxID=2498711 RepID=UPI002F3FE6B3